MPKEWQLTQKDTCCSTGSPAINLLASELCERLSKSFRRPAIHCRALLLLLPLVQGFMGGEPLWAESDSVAKLLAPVVQSHCAQCHGLDGNIEADVDLVNLQDSQLTTDLELLERLVDVLDLQEMPPEDESQLEPKVRENLVAELKSRLRTVAGKRRVVAHVPIRRMNRFQYNNAVTDLFDLKCIVFTLPERMMREHNGYFRPESGRMADVVQVGSRPLGKSQLIESRLAGVAAFPQDLRAENGYDNRGDHLSLSPLLMESFLKLGQSITESPDFSPKNVGIWNQFFVAPENEDALKSEVRTRLDAFLSKAFRQPADGESLDRYTSYVSHQLDAGVEFTEAMKAVAAAAISSPKFLYLYDKSAQDDSAQGLDVENETTAFVDDYELASRLSFFLWGSIPDQRLLELAAAGDLSKEEVLAEQVDRMLKDKKIKRFCDSFPSQWLQLERIISSVPDPEKFPDFYFAKYRDSMHMMLEPLLLFETILIENKPITQLIDSDFTYRSTLLEQAYEELGINQGKSQNGAVGVLAFNRVPVEDRRNGGIITNAAVMTMTSGPERTKPITRGAWIAAVIFNDPPEPPPADVPPLAEQPPAGEENRTLRERLALHRERSDCRGCHEQIDPLGFALENYNAVGVWREKYENGRDVDMEGTLFRTHRFTNVAEFKDAILAEKERFSRAFAGHLLSFGMARQLTAADGIALDRIVAATTADDYRIQTMLKQVVLSQPFRSKSIAATLNHTISE